MVPGRQLNIGEAFVAWVDTETGESGERRLTHRAEAEQFYRELKGNRYEWE
jgi:hypothetical protein